MGYETELQFAGVIIDQKLLQLFRTYVEKNRGNDSRAFHYMLQYLYLETNEHGYLDWNLSKDQKKQLKWLSGERPVPIHSIDFDKVDFVFVNFGVEGETAGKWYESDAFVEWLSSYCMGGRIIEISREGDGEIWGWEFDPRRRYRELGLVPVGKWRSSNTGLTPANRPQIRFEIVQWLPISYDNSGESHHLPVTAQ